MLQPVVNAAPAETANRRLSLEQVLQELIDDGLINRAADIRQIRTAGQLQGDNSKSLHPLVVIAGQKVTAPAPPHRPLSLEQLSRWLAGRCGLPYRHIDPLELDLASVGGIVSHAYASRYHILPLSIDGDTITFATAEPYLTDWIADLRNLLRKDIRRVVANPLDINRYLLEFYGLSRSVAGAERDGDSRQSAVPNFEQLLELGQSRELGAEDKPVVQIVDWLLQYAFEQRASDIHLEPRRDRGQVRFRIDGVLASVYELPATVMAAVTSRIKILGRMNVAERRRPQDGRIKTRTAAGREVELRLSTMPTAFGEKCVLRVFDPDVVVKDFRELGFSQREQTLWEHMTRQPHGIILVTGPTGSGKTTTLYSTLKRLASPEINVCTVEDPIEMIAPELNQMQVQPGIELGFAEGLRTLLRQDPDVIMVGEIRDLDTAQMAVQAALTGHLVFSTLHTNDAASAVTRLLDIGVPHYLIQSTLVGVVAQRLLRTLCAHCKTEAVPDPALWQSLVRPYAVDLPERVAAAAGCAECRDSGYLGRRAIYELLSMTPTLRQNLSDDGARVDVALFRKTAEREGMQRLRAGAVRAVLAGVTTLEEALKIVPPESLTRSAAA